jgi:hypothetical protein
MIGRRRRVSVARRTLWASVARAFGDVGHLVFLFIIVFHRYNSKPRRVMRCRIICRAPHAPI